MRSHAEKCARALGVHCNTSAAAERSRSRNASDRQKKRSTAVRKGSRSAMTARRIIAHEQRSKPTRLRALLCIELRRRIARMQLHQTGLARLPAPGEPAPANGKNAGLESSPRPVGLKQDVNKVECPLCVARRRVSPHWLRCLEGRTQSSSGRFRRGRWCSQPSS